MTHLNILSMLDVVGREVACSEFWKKETMVCMQHRFLSVYSALRKSTHGLKVRWDLWIIPPPTRRYRNENSCIQHCFTQNAGTPCPHVGWLEVIAIWCNGTDEDSGKFQFMGWIKVWRKPSCEWCLPFCRYHYFFSQLYFFPNSICQTSPFTTTPSVEIGPEN